MIFQTITNDDGTIGLGSGIKDIKNLFKKQQLFSSSDIQAIKAYNAQIDACVTSQTAFRRTMMDASESAQNLVAGANGGKVALNALEGSSKAAAVGMQILSTAMNVAVIMLVTQAISLLINKFSDYTHKLENAREAAKEAKSSIEELNTSVSDNGKWISENVSNYEKLADGVDSLGRNISLTDEEFDKYNSLTNEIADMFPTLVTGYTDTGDAILSCKNNVDLLTQAYKEQKQAAQDAVFQKSDDLWAGFKADTTDWHPFSNGGMSKTTERTILQDMIDGNDLSALDWNTIATVLDNAGIETNKWIGGSDKDLKKKLEENKKTLYAYARTLDSTMESATSNVTPIIDAYLDTNKDFKKYNSDTQNRIKQIADNMGYEFYSTFENKADLVDWIDNTLVPAFDNVDSKNLLNELFSLNTDDMSVNEYVSKINTLIKKIANIVGGNAEEIKIKLGFDFVDTDEELLNKAKQKVEKAVGNSSPASGVFDILGNATKSDNEKELNKWIDSLSESDLQLIVDGKIKFDEDTTVDSAKKALDAARKEAEQNPIETPILSLSETITELDKVKEKMDVVDKTYAKLFDKDENIGFEDYSNIAEAFKDVSGIENYIDRLQKAGQNAESVKQVMSSLTGAYIEQSGILDKVNEQNAGLIEQTLTEMGVENSHELVLQRLSVAKEIAALKSFDLANATTADILKLVEEGKVSEETANYLLQYALKKELANGTTLTTDSDIENIKKLVLALGGAIDELNAFQNAKNGVLRQLKNPNKTKKHTGNTKIFDEGSYSTESQEKAQDEIDSVLTKQYKYSGGSATSKAVNDAAKAAKDAAKDVKEAVAETFDFIENGINRFDRALSKLEDKAGKTSSSFTSRLNAYKEALNATTFGIELLTDDYNKYMQKANEVGLNEDIASAVRGGASNIWDYTDDTVKQQIKDYQSWYDKAQDCLDKIDELKDKQLELTQASIELLITQYEKLSTKVENANDRMEKWISLKESWGFSANTKNYDSMNKNIQKQIDYINKQDEQLKLLQKTVTKGSEAWYEYNERIDSNKTSLIELKQQMQENATAAAVLAKATADKKTEKYDSQDELYDAKIDNATSAKSKNKLIDKKISNINKTQKAYNTAVSTDNKNLKSAKKTIGKFKSTKENKKVLASIKKAAKAGKRISQSLLDKASKLNDNGKLYNACVQYNAYWDAKQSDKATADLYKETAKQDKADLAKEKFDNISSDYDNKISSNEQKKTALNNKISLAQEQGKQVSAAYYKSLISSEKGEKNKLIKERKDLQKSLNDAVIKGSIKKGSDEWYEMVSAINEVTNAIDESTQSIVEYQNALRQLKWDAFDKSMETVKRINSENDYYIDLMSHKDMTDKDTGNFTKYGTATIGLHKTNYDNYLAQADEYQREYNKIMRQIEKGELSLSDENVVQRLRDLQDAHRDAKKSAEDELQSIQDLVKQGYEAQTDALSELIDKYKKLKDSELEAYKYQKEIAEKTKTIASLQKQLTAYNGNDSEESRAQIQKLKVQLEESKSDLQDTIYERYLSDTEDMLDDLMNDYQEFINEKLNDTNNILDEIKTLLGSDIIETIKGLDSNLTNDTKDQIGSSTTNGGDGGQAAKDYVHNTVTNDQNKVNSKTDTSSYDPAKEADIAKKKNEISQKKKAINDQRQSFQNQIKELESQLKQLYGELNSVENKYQFEKSSTKNKDKLQDLKNNYIEKKSGLNAMIQDVTHNKDVLQQFIADLDKQSAQLDTDLVSLKGYEKGSEHIDKRQLAWTQENKRELIYRAADGALLTELNPGDKVFTNEMTENLWELAKTNPSLLCSSTNFVPKLPDIAKSAGTSTIVEVGDIVMNGVNDPETFGRQLREEICKNGKTTQCITEAVSAKQLKKNSIGNARLYK